MTRAALIALLVCFMAAPAPARAAKDSVTGIYEMAHSSGMIVPLDDGEACTAPAKMEDEQCIETFEATDMLGLYEQKNGDLDFAATLLFFNGHSCTIVGTAQKAPYGWSFVSPDDPACELTIKKTADAIVFDETEGHSCNWYCGARGTLDDASFPRVSKSDYVPQSAKDIACLGSMETVCTWAENKGKK